MLIRATVVKKTDMRNFDNERGRGKYFSADLRDKTGEIRCVAFEEIFQNFAGK